MSYWGFTRDTEVFKEVPTHLGVQWGVENKIIWSELSWCGAL